MDADYSSIAYGVGSQTSNLTDMYLQTMFSDDYVDVSNNSLMNIQWQTYSMVDRNMSMVLDEEKGLLKQPPLLIVLLIVLYTTVFIAAIFNNYLILTVVYK